MIRFDKPRPIRRGDPEIRGRERIEKPTSKDQINRDRSRSRSRGDNSDDLMGAELEERRAEEAQIDCFLSSVSKDSFSTMMLDFWNIGGDEWPKNWFYGVNEGEIESLLENILPVFIISLHGGLPVLRNAGIYDYKTFLAKSVFYRLIKTPNACCSVILPKVRQKYLDSVIKILNESNSNIDDIINKIKAALLELSFDLKRECLTKEQLKSPIERSIFECKTEAFEIVDTLKGQPVINKLWKADVYQPGDEIRIFEGGPLHKLAPRGILFCTNVFITLPTNWSGVNAQTGLLNAQKYDYRPRFGDVTLIDHNTNSFNGQRYNIGELNPTGTIIHYSAGTNLLSCPYFMQFASEKLHDRIITLNNSLSLGENNKHLIPMVTRITAEVLYWFLCRHKFLSIDMSCESLVIYDNNGKNIQEIATAELKEAAFRSQLQKLFNIFVQGVLRLRGGNRKTRCNPKKYNTKKYKTKKYKKRGNTKTKKYKKRNLSQKQ
jgi:hypothetical protein